MFEGIVIVLDMITLTALACKLVVRSIVLCGSKINCVVWNISFYLDGRSTRGLLTIIVNIMI